MNVLIVSPEVGGVPGVGGVGTFVYHLSHVLSAGNRVSILSTDVSIKDELATKYSRSGIQVINVPTWVQTSSRISQSRFILDFLLENPQDHVVFSDWGGAGYFATAARELNLLKKTICTVVAHGCTTWAYGGLKQFLSESNPLEHYLKVTLERRSMAQADYLVSPSEYMKNWTSQYIGSSKIENKIVLKQPYFLESTFTSEIEDLGLEKSFVFFGRLEERKGLRLFTAAVLEFYKNYSDRPKIFVLGKSGWMKTGEFGHEFVNREFKASNYQIDFEILTDLKSDEALNLISQNNSIVVIPSQLDNAPYTIVESILKGFRVISIKTGGIPEYLPISNISENNPASLSRKMYEIGNLMSESLHPTYDTSNSNLAWRKFIANPEEFTMQ